MQGKDKWCCQCPAPHCEATDQIVNTSKEEGGPVNRGEEGHEFKRLERRECRSGEQWEGETNRISKKGAETQSNEGVSAALQGCFLSRCLFRGVKVTQGHNVQVPVYLGSISDLSPLSLSPSLCVFVCLCSACTHAFVYTGVSISICLCGVCMFLYYMWACIFWMYINMSQCTWECVHVQTHTFCAYCRVLNWINLRNHSRHGGVAHDNGNELVSGHQVFRL